MGDNQPDPGPLLWIGLSGPELTGDDADRLRRIRPGGVVLFARNLRDGATLMELIRSLKQTTDPPPIIAIDQEGGKVQRLRGILPDLPPVGWWHAHRAVLATGQRQVAECLRALGISMNLAPVVDLAYPNGWITRQGRCYHDRPRPVTAWARTFVEAYRAAGVMTCLKHFPGLGAAQPDTHRERAVVRLSEHDLWSQDLMPYRRVAARAPAVMVSHAEYPALDAERPASLAPAVYRLLRGPIGFRSGLALTDDLHMEAVAGRWSSVEAAREAVFAGADGLLFCQSPEAVELAYEELRLAVAHGRFRDRVRASCARLERVRRTYRSGVVAMPDPDRFADAVRNLETFLHEQGWNPWAA